MDQQTILGMDQHTSLALGFQRFTNRLRALFGQTSNLQAIQSAGRSLLGRYLGRQSRQQLGIFLVEPRPAFIRGIGTGFECTELNAI